jgi:hypothetical protein
MSFIAGIEHSNLLEEINPRFRRWLDAQSVATQEQVLAAFDETAKHQDINHVGKHGLHARQARTIEAALGLGYTHE